MIWNLRIRRPSPSMDQDRVVFEAPSYTEAVQRALEAHRRTGCSVSLSSGEYGMQNWHSVIDGIATDRNTNSGVPTVQEVK